jgi:hypothetical protein
MKSLSAVVGIWIFLFSVGSANAQAKKQMYVGKSSCEQEIQSERPDFSMGLDATQKTYLIHRYQSESKILLLVQLQGDTDRCGVVRDVIEIHDVSKEFEFSCVDPEVPGDIVIGSSKRKDNMEPITAIDAWRIDPKQNRFERITCRIRCVNENPLSAVNRGDLAEQAKQRAAQKKSSR